MYEKRTCSTCRRVAELLTERGIDFDRVEYHEGISESRLRELLAKAQLRPAEMVRARELLAGELLSGMDLPQDELIRVLTGQRPIVERGDRALLARPPERVLELLARLTPQPRATENDRSAGSSRRFIKPTGENDAARGTRGSAAL